MGVAARHEVPFLYRSASFESARPTPALQAARNFADVDGDYGCRGMVLEGGVGCGKTHALVCTLREIAVAVALGGGMDETAFFSFPELSRLLLDRERLKATMEACCESDVLILDDLGSGHTKAGGFVVSCVEEFIVHREACRYQLLMSTNLAPRSFRTMFGARVFDRLRGPWGAWINVDGPSLRRKASR